MVANTKRNVSLDALRILALFLVVSVHFFLNSDFYQQDIVGINMYIMVLIRSFCMICVPLFMVLTGYLMNKKQLNKKYYLGISKTLCIYILASVACLIYRVFVLNENMSFVDLIVRILNFQAAPYSWYIEMYIGLFLLIPFLNICYNNIDCKKNKKTFLLTLLILTSIPSVINIFNFSTNNWWLQPSIDNSYCKLFPNWWIFMYPITYYFIGCYLKEYHLKINRRNNILLIIASIILFGTFNYYRSYNSTFVSGSWQDFGSIFNVVMTVLVFNLVLNIDFTKLPTWIKHFLAKVSDICLGGYLVSYIFDNMFYGILNTNIISFPERLKFYLAIVLAVFICSLILSYLLNLVYKILNNLFIRILDKIKKISWIKIN